MGILLNLYPPLYKEFCLKKIFAIAALAASLGFAAQAQTPAPAAAAAATANPVRLGVLLGFTGPIESLTPAMAASAELAIREVNASGPCSCAARAWKRCAPTRPASMPPPPPPPRSA